jgi:uncharacterized protein (TIGR02391 family)
MASNNKQRLLIIQELKEFYTQLKMFRDLYVERMKAKIVLGSEERRRESIREELVRKSGGLKQIVVHLTGKQYGQQFNESFDIWTEALGASLDSPLQRWCLRALTDNVNEAIGRLEAEPELEKLFKMTPLAAIETQGIKNVTAELPLEIFDAMQFHRKVVEASRELFKDGHYRDAVYRAFVEVVNFVKRKAKSQLDGKKLMSTIFSPDNPKIRLNPLETQTDRDEQEGFMYLFMGAVQGIRNPKAHENIIQNNPYIALQLIGFANLLIETVDFWEVEDT